MSKESYLKGEEKLKAITIIKVGLGVRLNVSQILRMLQKRGIYISERTYRRLKLEMYQSAGNTMDETFRKQGEVFFDELLSFEEMERQCWKLYWIIKKPNEKLRAISQLRLIADNKMKIMKNLPGGMRTDPLNYPRLCDDLKEFDKGVPQLVHPSLFVTKNFARSKIHEQTGHNTVKLLHHLQNQMQIPSTKKDNTPQKRAISIEDSNFWYNCHSMPNFN